MRKITLQQQMYTISGKSNINIGIEITPDKVQFTNECDDIEFVFKDCNNLETLERWQEVIKLLDMAVDFAKQALDNPKAHKLVLKTPKGASAKGKTIGR